MKRFLTAAACAAMLVSVAAPGAHAIGVFASWWNADDADDDGFGGGIKHDVRMVPLIGADIRASYIAFSDVNIIPIEGAARVNLGSLYAGLGAGYYFLDADIEFEDAFGWFLLGGIDFGLGGTGVFGELKWTMLTSDIKDSNQSVDFDGVGVNVGFKLGL